MRTVRLLLVALGAALVCCAGDGTSMLRADDRAQRRASVKGDALVRALRATLAADPPPFPGARENWEALRAFYAARQHQPIWVGPRGTGGSVSDLLSAICDAENEGLRASDYRPEELERALSAIEAAPKEAEPLASAEVLFSLAYVRYGLHLATGRIPPKRAGWATAHRELDAAKVLSLLRDGDARDALAALAPTHEQYRNLKRALRNYRELKARGDPWPEVPRGPLIEPGARDPRVAVVRKRLGATGEVPHHRAADREIYDPSLVEAVKRFQEQHGLEPDGRIGGETLSELRATIDDRIAQLEVNLERWRWMPENLGARHVLVNIPSYDLQAFENGKRVLRMRAIAGLPDWPTPVFSAQLEGVRFRPEWAVPQKITAEEIVPKLEADPRFAEKVGLRVIAKDDGSEVDPATVEWTALDPEGDLPFRFVHPAGDTNPLGKVRFVMPNRYAVYLHDTPEDSLFTRTARAFSHGCVRVERPEELTAFVLRGGEGWSQEAVSKAFASTERRTVDAADPAQVHLVYFTAWIDDDGMLRVLKDVYRQDAVMKRLLGEGRGEEPAICA
jgi:murein L,D-transpeptidase YcbB/YkuD